MQDIPREAFRAVLDTVFAAPQYAWRESRDPLAFLRRWWTSLLTWLDTLRDSNPDLFRLLFWGLVALLVLLLLHAGWVVIRTLRAGPAGTGSAATFPAPRRDAAWYRREAQRLAEKGRLLEAMQADMIALLLELDARRIVRYHAGKTAQEHVAEAAVSEAARAELRDLVWAFYRHAFAREPLSPATAAAWRARAMADRYAAAH
jgi:Domain of unknown function (DUF4129)